MVRKDKKNRTCERCGCECSSPQMLRAHLNRKNPCRPRESIATPQLETNTDLWASSSTGTTDADIFQAKPLTQPPNFELTNVINSGCETLELSRTNRKRKYGLI